MRREELLNEVVTELQENGLGDRSLRDVASGVGTSHRMLIHHFGSRGGLLTAVVRHVDAQQRKFWEEIGGRPGSMEMIWQRLSEPRLRPAVRLFFECYVRACNGEHPFNELLPGVIKDWTKALVETGLVGDGPPDTQEARARLGLAVFRGLLLDLIALDDPRPVGAAVREFQGLVDLGRSAEGKIFG